MQWGIILHAPSQHLKGSMHPANPVEHPRTGRGPAHLISEAFAPAILVTAFVLLSVLGGAPSPHAGVYAVIAVFFTTVLPLGGVLLLVRRGLVTDHHISDRRQRPPVLAGALVSIAAGLFLLLLVGAPWRVTGTVLCTVAGVVAVLVVNLWWKLSAHSAVAVFVVVGSMSLLGGWAAVLVPVPIAVGWARVRLRAHTPAQVAAGVVVGLLIGAGFHLLVVGPTA